MPTQLTTPDTPRMPPPGVKLYLHELEQEMDAFHSERNKLSKTARRIAIDEVTITAWVRTSVTIDVSLTPTMEQKKQAFDDRTRAFRLGCDATFNRAAKMQRRLRQVLVDFNHYMTTQTQHDRLFPMRCQASSLPQAGVFSSEENLHPSDCELLPCHMHVNIIRGTLKEIAFVIRDVRAL